jgi:hypothetical protein
MLLRWVEGQCEAVFAEGGTQGGEDLFCIGCQCADSMAVSGIVCEDEFQGSVQYVGGGLGENRDDSEGASCFVNCHELMSVSPLAGWFRELF